MKRMPTAPLEKGAHGRQPGELPAKSACSQTRLLKTFGVLPPITWLAPEQAALGFFGLNVMSVEIIKQSLIIEKFYLSQTED